MINPCKKKIDIAVIDFGVAFVSHSYSEILPRDRRSNFFQPILLFPLPRHKGYRFQGF